jgi:hypothetical protein
MGKPNRSLSEVCEEILLLNTEIGKRTISGPYFIPAIPERIESIGRAIGYLGIGI